jgi:hypothetical protein
MRTATVKLRRSVLFSLLLIAATLSSCVVGDDGNGMSADAVSGDKDVVFRIAVPYAAENGSHKTRAIGTDEENTINPVYVLAFKVENDNSETFDYSAIACKATDNGNEEENPTQKFTVTVKVKPHKQRFVVIANADTETAALLGRSTWKGALKNTMLAQLEVGLSAGDKWNATGTSNYTAFPMWGESGKETVSASTTGLQGSIPLLRMVAKIDVQLDESETGPTDKFQLKSVMLYNTNTKGRVVPASFTDGQDNGERYLWVTAPTIPADIAPDNKRHKGPLAYTGFEDDEEDVAMRGAIYTFETAAPEDGDRLKATCLVVGGVFDANADSDFDEPETFYRVDFLEDDGDGGKTFRHILRNHQYTVNVVDVTGPGHDTSDEAFEGGSDNQLSAKVTVWSSVDQAVRHVQYFLNVSREEVTLEAAANSSATLTAETDYTISNRGFPAGIVVEITPQGRSWLSFSISGTGNNPKTITLTATTENSSSIARTAQVYVKAGNLTKVITVTQ